VPFAASATYTANGQLVADLIRGTTTVGLAVTSAHGYSDVPGLLKWLDKYPYGCIEQTTSRAMPLLVFNDLSDLAGLPRDQDLRQRAKALRSAVEKRFWLPDVGFYAIAIDGTGLPCRVRASNPGHLLYTGLPTPPRAARVVEQLLSASFNNGWGLRTLASDQARFNPMSYHNGSVWPHDTALCAAGMAAYGHRDAAAKLLSESFDAAMHFGMRLPELYCGFVRRSGEPPVGYPVACLPQAWSSGAPFMLLQACLGLTVDGLAGVLRIDRPVLPRELEFVALHDVAIGGTRVSVAFQRAGDRVMVAPIGAMPPSVEIVVRA